MSINLELLDLRAFLAIFDTSSFRKSANLLSLSQPALSRRVQRLETQLRACLFERSTRRVEATVAGQRFEPVATRNSPSSRARSIHSRSDVYPITARMVRGSGSGDVPPPAGWALARVADFGSIEFISPCLGWRRPLDVRRR
jgi:hypothetical protein